MNQIPVQEPAEDSLSAKQVEDYLYQYPEFFAAHLDLLEAMKIPHPCGEAVSLIAKQLELLRKKNRKLQQQLNTLIGIARDNDTLLRRTHKLTLTLVEASTLEECLINLEDMFHHYFQVDFIAIRIFKRSPDTPFTRVFIDPKTPLPDHFDSLFRSGRPRCGPLDEASAQFLFGDNAGEVISCALVPLLRPSLKGLLAIGSRSKERFHPGMDPLFLTHMGEIIGSRLNSFCDTPAP